MPIDTYDDLAALVAYGNIIIDKRGRRFDPRLHPRGHDGKFIRTGGVVKILGSAGRVVGKGKVRGVLSDGRVWVDNATPGGQPFLVRPNKVESENYKARLDNATLPGEKDHQRPDRNGFKMGVGDDVILPDGTQAKVTNTGDGLFEVTKQDGTKETFKPSRLRAVNQVKPEAKANLKLLDESGNEIADLDRKSVV